MNLVEFDMVFANSKSDSKVQVDDLCDHEHHEKKNKSINKSAARRNIQKNGGKKFICRDCMMKYDNPYNKVGENRHTDEEIDVLCPHPDHIGERYRKMRKRCYFGELKKPYIQTCGSCVQLGKTISEEQKEKTSKKLKGKKISEEHRLKIAKWWADHPDDIRKQNLKQFQNEKGEQNEST